MAESKKLTLSADGLTATVAPATLGDIASTALSMESTLTGWYGLAQKAAIAVAAMAYQNNKLGQGLNPFKS